MKTTTEIYETLVINKVVHGGQGLGVLEDGRKAFIWNALPGERVRALITKRKKDFVEGIAEEILEASTERIEPRELIYLATSPWQIMPLSTENKYKKEIITETFRRESIELPEFEVESDGKDYEYRNKIEFSFYGDDDGLHYAFYNRGTHQKQIVEGSALALSAINSAAQNLLVELNKMNLRAGDLKSVILRCTQEGKVVAALFVKPKKFTNISTPDGLAGFKVYHSNPRSPASVATELIYARGDTGLQDVLLGTAIAYDVIGFFQVNLPLFESALKQIEFFTAGAMNIVDMYSGVGTIGIPIGDTKTLVEIDSANVAMARRNIGDQDINVVEASTEKALEYITSDTCLIVDPPRSGLHKDVVKRILEAKPKQICYLSCNPATQARDVALLSEAYVIKNFEGYNFFPRTPHIETLVMLAVK